MIEQLQMLLSVKESQEQKMQAELEEVADEVDEDGNDDRVKRH